MKCYLLKYQNGKCHLLSEFTNKKDAVAAYKELAETLKTEGYEFLHEYPDYFDRTLCIIRPSFVDKGGHTRSASINGQYPFYGLCNKLYLETMGTPVVRD